MRPGLRSRRRRRARFKRYLAGRRVVDVQGPAGHALRRRHRPSADDRRARRGHSRPPARGESRWSSCAFRSNWIASDRRRRARRGRFGLAAGERTPRDRSPSPRTARSSKATPPPASRASAGHQQSDHDASADVRAYPDAIAQALSQLRLVGVNGPYSVVLGADAYTALAKPATTAIRCWSISSA
jgi:hypothetical protein